MSRSTTAFPDSILCYCLGGAEFGCSKTHSCRTKKGAACFHSIEEVFDEETKSTDTYEAFGCLPPEEGGSLFQCKAYLSPHKTPKTIGCCYDRDFCNENLTISYRHEKNENQPTLEKGTIDSAFSTFIAVLVPCVFMILIIAIIFVWWWSKKSRCSKNRWAKVASFIQDEERDMMEYSSSGNGSIDTSSGSGSGMPQLVQRTIAKELQWEKQVGKGRFGEVFKAHWHGETVAAKIFQTIDEASWKREKEVYQTMMLRHENILCFYAADIYGTGGTTHMVLVTAYHENGSLHDFLKSRTLDYETTCRLAYSAAAGLAHLHVEINGTEGKPGIAHRDIKSKNILVKDGGVCIIADFGLAVRHTSRKGELDIVPNPRQGTIRYMAPEVLNDTINKHEFEAYKRADMYAFSLVLWEIASRCHGKDGKGRLEVCPYKVPYEGMVPPDPNIDTMRNLVCKVGDREGIRPPIYKQWLADDILLEFAARMEECWHGKPHNRLTSLNVKKKLNELIILARNMRNSTPSPPPPGHYEP